MRIIKNGYYFQSHCIENQHYTKNSKKLMLFGSTNAVSFSSYCYYGILISVFWITTTCYGWRTI